MDSLKNSEILEELIQSVIIPKVKESVNQYLVNDLKEKIEEIVIQFIMQIDEAVGSNIEIITSQGEQTESLVQKATVMYADLIQKLNAILQTELFTNESWKTRDTNKKIPDVSGVMVT